MKKFLFCLLSLVTAFALALAGCGGSTPLSFSSAFSGQDEDPSSYKEVAVYNVNYVADYNGLKKENVLNNYVYFEFTNGTYTTVLETIDRNTLTQENIESDILDDLTINSDTIYKYTTTFTIDAKYEVFDKQATYNFSDSIVTETYFCSYRMSYAPIYTKTTNNYSSLTVSGGVADVPFGASVCQTFYNKNSFRTIKEYYPTLPADENFLLDREEYTQEYDYKTAIDNTQLLFAIRNIAVNEEQTDYLPTISYQYTSAKTLHLTNTNFSTEKLDFTYNGQQVNKDITLRNYSISLSNGNNSGLPHFASVMKEKTETVGQVLLTSYTQPLICYGAMYCMGALHFTLSSFTTL